MSLKIIFSLLFLCVSLDQVTKFFITSKFLIGESFKVLPFLDFTLVHNTGVAFSFLSEGSASVRWLLVFIVFLIICYLLFTVIKLRNGNKLELLSLLLILSGGLGNLFDRLFFGYVIDFIHLHYETNSFYIFNLADSWITIGAILYIIYFFFFEKPEHENKTSQS